MSGSRTGALLLLAVLTAGCTRNAPFQRLYAGPAPTLLATRLARLDQPRVDIPDVWPKPRRAESRPKAAPGFFLGPGLQAGNPRPYAGGVTAALLCIHSHEEWDWSYQGPFDGGLQFLPASWNAAAIGAGLPEYANGDAGTWPESVQLTVGAWWYLHTDPHQQWPLSSRLCGL